MRSDGTILRPMNAFMLWAKEKRVEMMKQGLQVAEVSQVNPSSQLHLNQPTAVLNRGSGGGSLNLARNSILMILVHLNVHQ